MTKYALKDKKDGKWLTYGNMTMGEKGPRVGLRVTADLKSLISSKPDGEWVNLLGFADDKNNAADRRASNGAESPCYGDGSEIPF